MMTSKDLTTLNFLEFSSQGRRYVRAYKNEWISKKVTGKVKGVSRAKEQHHVFWKNSRNLLGNNGFTKTTF